MSPSTPSLTIRVGIRDHWDREDAPINTARSAVKQLLGIDIALEVAWEDLLLDLGDDYPDKSTFIPSVAAASQAFLNGLCEILEKEINPEWSDTLLERAGGRLRVSIGASKNGEATVTWSSKDAGFNVGLPRGSIPSSNELQSHFKDKLLDCFTGPQTPPEDWADVSIDATYDKPASTKSHEYFDTLPDISILPRPDELLLKPPYHLVIYGGGKSMVEVQCSHSPTLELLAEYLKKWCKINHRDTRHPPAVEVKLHQSAFGFGLTYDRLTMSIEHRNPDFLVSPMIVLSFVERVLNYKSVSIDSSSWIFRRDVEFKTIK
ncbi:uncharacterized protein F4822DRAFT_337435 [Hypoxylon trugodes]|uniref:uncharacterized protein n=1 Tax=Hypoxylon trugodes TaxID=326681 RepID=UPI00218ED705|nr:uncharacterized protein F4822DRAFT_337435 [Hypoxylon trugodes]KAI1385208.1 hypothetical protein F4822DRAFT_337435 [Hypoxylon trugodes]